MQRYTFNIIPVILAVVFSLPTPLAAQQDASAQAGFDLFDNFGTGQQAFLPADEAFRVSVEAKDTDHWVAHFEIAEGYYLYRDKFNFTSTDNTVVLRDAHYPPGKIKEDLAFGQVEVYRHGVDITLPIEPHSSGTLSSVDLKVGYQGCADAGICYPPIKKTLPVALLAADTGVTKTAIGQAPELKDRSIERPKHKPKQELERSQQDRIADTLETGSLLPVLAIFLGFGLVLSLTPCVLPMIPILSGIIVGQGPSVTTTKAFFLSLAYVLAMALTYAVAGVLAGMFGQNLQAAFQAPWVIITFSLVFVVLALSMFGLFELQIPAWLQTRMTGASQRQARGTYSGAAAMGVLSAIIVGPCVAPPLAGALIYIGQTGNALLGGSALFAMALGMGLPLIAIGASAGHLLPKAGVWMETVKQFSGVVMLGVAIWFLERILPAPVSLFLWGCLLIGTAVFFGATDRLEASAGGGQRFLKGVGLVSLIYGAILILGASVGGTDVFQPLQSLVTRTDSPRQGETQLTFKPIKGLAELQREVSSAKVAGRSVLLDFYADWCIECKRMDKNTFADTAVQGALNGVVLLQADVTANDDLDKQLLQAFDLYGPPATLFFGGDGQERPAYRLVGYLSPDEFIMHVKEALAS